MTVVRKPAPFRKPQTFRGLETAPGAVAPSTCVSTAAAYAVPDEHAATSRVAWDDPRPRAAQYAAPFGEPVAHAGVTRVPSQLATAHDAVRRARWSWPPTTYRKASAYRKSRSFRGLEALASPAREHTTVAPWQRATRFDRDASLPWAETAQRIDAMARLPHRVASALDISRTMPWGSRGAHQRALSAFWDNIRAHGGHFALPWGPIGRRRSDYVIPWPVEPNPGEPGSDPITVPILPVYFMIPTMTAVRLPERTPVPLLSASFSTDVTAWGWSFTAAMPQAAMALVNPSTRESPVELEIAVNGYKWTFLVEAVDDGRRFNSKTATLRGRTRSAMLADPYAPKRSRIQASARTAAQLADEELDGTGWTMVWDALDWLVPGGTFSYAELEPIAALQRIAASIGARLETDRELLQLAVKPTYPVSPWAWDAATPYAIIPATIVAGTDGNYAGGTNANGVYVYGENAGFGALVKITGTGGERQATMVVDPLTSTADPVRERGRHELALAGKKKTEQVTTVLMPSPAAPGLIPLGALVEIDDGTATWRGQTMGVTINASRSGSAISVRQILQVERQFR